MTTTEAQNICDTISLQKQDLKNLDVSNLTPLSPEVISRQATINIGTIGHVAHGKSTVVKAISGVQTVRFKNELERNITIKLERISDRHIQALLTNPELLREFDELQSLKYIKMKTKRRQSIKSNALLSKSNVTDLFTKPKAELKSNVKIKTTTKIQPNNYYTIFREETPSSGYESSFDVSSIKSGDSTNNKHNFLKSKLKRPHNLQHNVYLLEKPKQSKEYIIESIKSVEYHNGIAVFNVKWLGYPSECNTWEPLDNIKECRQLAKFVERMTKLHHKVILRLRKELQSELKEEKELSRTKPNIISELSNYDPTYLKIHLILLAQFVLTKYHTKATQKLRQKVLQALMLEYIHRKRKEQLISLQKWQQNMNQVEHEAPIIVENTVDLDVLDANFIYITNNIISKDVTPVKQLLNGCNCRIGCSQSSNCCARRVGECFAYDKNGILRINQGKAIYECNENCSCSIDCPNRVIQRGRKNSLCIFKTVDRGWGVRTDKLMLKGEFVAEYVGEIITMEEADERGKRYDSIGRTYLFDLDYDTTNTKYTIDAANFGNITHFINHSCSPNLGVYPFWIDHLVTSMQRLAFFTLRHIKAGEELTFDYINTEYENFNSIGKIPCRCGAKNCRKVLF